MAAIYMWIANWELYTTTIYPIESREAIDFTIDLDSGTMYLIPEDDMDIGGTFISASLLVILLSTSEQDDSMDIDGTFISATLSIILLDSPEQDDVMDIGGTFISASLDPILINSFHPDEALDFTIDLDPSNCSMTAA